MFCQKYNKNKNPCQNLSCHQPHHCGSLVPPLLCALFLPPGFCLFKVTKILSRSILRKYLRGSLPSKVPSEVPLGYFISLLSNHLPNTLRTKPFTTAISCAINFLQNCLPSKVPSRVPFGYFKLAQCPSFQKPFRYPSPPILHMCQIM